MHDCTCMDLLEICSFEIYGNIIGEMLLVSMPFSRILLSTFSNSKFDIWERSETCVKF
jgi:hypothetical protein